MGNHTVKKCHKTTHKMLFTSNLWSGLIKVTWQWELLMGIWGRNEIGTLCRRGLERYLLQEKEVVRRRKLWKILLNWIENCNKGSTVNGQLLRKGHFFQNLSHYPNFSQITLIQNCAGLLVCDFCPNIHIHNILYSIHPIYIPNI